MIIHKKWNIHLSWPKAKPIYNFWSKKLYGSQSCKFVVKTLSIKNSHTQSYYIEVAQEDIFMEQKNVIWAGFGPIGNAEKKKFGPIMSNFWGRFFNVFMGEKKWKHCSVCTEKLHRYFFFSCFTLFFIGCCGIQISVYNIKVGNKHLSPHLWYLPTL